MDIWCHLSTIFQWIAFSGLFICFFLELFNECAVKREKRKKKFLSIIIMCVLTTAFFSIMWVISLVKASDKFCA